MIEGFFLWCEVVNRGRGGKRSINLRCATMDFELRAAKAKWEKEQKEKKERARKRLELEKKARDEATKRQEAIETAQRVRRMEESAAALAVCI